MSEGVGETSSDSRSERQFLYTSLCTSLEPFSNSAKDKKSATAKECEKEGVVQTRRGGKSSIYLPNRRCRSLKSKRGDGWNGTHKVGPYLLSAIVPGKRSPFEPKEAARVCVLSWRSNDLFFSPPSLSFSLSIPLVPQPKMSSLAGLSLEVS